MISGKNGQLFLASMLLLLVATAFIYSLETENTYKSYSGKSGISENVQYETCQVATLSNGTYLDERFSNLTGEVNDYCKSQSGMGCNLSIVKQTGAPTNDSQLNHTHYNYSLDYRHDSFELNKTFNCTND